jgi:hypothetical protein
MVSVFKKNQTFLLIWLPSGEVDWINGLIQDCKNTGRNIAEGKIQRKVEQVIEKIKHFENVWVKEMLFGV